MLRKRRDPRRAQERADGRMIQEDHTAISNCSPRFISKEWPKYEMHADIWNDAVCYRSRNGDSIPAKHDPLGT